MMLTIFTPTYNRAHLLPRVYESLAAQARKDFEWLVVDDGSTDGTAAVVEELCVQSTFPVRYFAKKNGGKHTAHNLALQMAKGDLFCCLDSDDILERDAVEMIAQKLSHLTERDCGLVAPKSSLEGECLCTPLDGVPHGGLYELSVTAGASGEFVLVFKTEVLRRYPFPVIGSERFMGECVLYDRLELDGYTLYPVNRSLQRCEYQEDGLSRNFYRAMLQSPVSYQLYHAQRIDLVTSFPQRLRHCVQYQAFRWLSGNKTVAYSGPHRALAAAMRLPGALGALYYKMKKDQ